MNSENILKNWNNLKAKPFGKCIFSFIIGKKIPYTGSVSPQVFEISKGKSVIKIKDKKKHRNHLNSLHAIALANIGEFATGVCVLSLINNQTRFILKNLKIDFLKKARGEITAICECQDDLNFKNHTDYQLTAKLFDKNKDVVASVTTNWLIGPKKQ